MYKEIKKCRICGKSMLKTITDLGQQQLTGVFPLPDESVESGPLDLVKCTDPEGCGLVQLRYSFEPDKMYGDNYGYRSGLNKSMVAHLNEITKENCKRVVLNNDDLVIDIGSNDGTLLSTYKNNCDKSLDLLGIDPTGIKFKKYYKEGINLIPNFFSAETVHKSRPDKKAAVITSIAMFYDFESPIDFAKNISEVLSDKGIWVTEQSYMPLMVQTNSYDTICHEHLEFYTLRQIKWIADNAGLKICDVVTNNINGGSFRITLAKAESDIKVNSSVSKLLTEEEEQGANSEHYFDAFNKSIQKHKLELITFLKEQKKAGKLVLGYGASTKGNVVLQYCGITKDILPAIAEVNEDKFGHVTPGTNIPIISETDAKNMHPDYFLVLPWHFKDNILEREQEYRKESGCKFVFYLPQMEID